MSSSSIDLYPPRRANLAWSLFFKASKLVEDDVESHLAAANQISTTELRILFKIRESGHSEVRPSDIASALHLTRSNVSRAITSLSQKGLISRNQPSWDLRVTLLNVTDAGQRACEEGMDVVRQVQQRLFLDVLSDDDCEALIAILNSVVDQSLHARARRPVRLKPVERMD